MQANAFTPSSKTRRRSAFALAVIAVSCLSTHRSSADVIPQTAQMTDSIRWNANVWGSPATAPIAAHNYVSDGMDVRTGSINRATTFDGASLTLRNGAALQHKATNAIVNLHLESGGTVNNAAESSARLSGTLSVGADQIGVLSSTNSARILNVDSLISGEGTIQIKSNASAFATSSIVITNGENRFSGTWQVSQGRLLGTTAGAFGTGSFVVQSGRLDIEYAFSSTLSSLTLSGGQFDLSNGFNHTFGSVVIGGRPLTAGTYSYADFGPDLQAFFIAGNDTITVASIPEPSTYAVLLRGGTVDLASQRTGNPAATPRT